MEIKATGLGKKFNYHWIFKNLDFEFKINNAYAITGPNGSGKSTLLQIISGYITPTTGGLTHTLQGNNLDPNHIYRHLVLVAPYLKLVEEFTLMEQLNFHFQFKTIKTGWNISDIIEIMELKDSIHKQIKYFSSGMKQRLKLGLGFYSQCELLLLDEPTSNLDEPGIQWYLDYVKKSLSDRLVIISSNRKQEYSCCQQEISLKNYK
ncbi:MAG: ATP-binding cassette domain-containing protein [Bacteroidetes bacterium]|nr:ATP-binding cassette domain-containing protein [Bacteroidota bacterium]